MKKEIRFKLQQVTLAPCLQLELMHLPGSHKINNMIDHFIRDEINFMKPLSTLQRQYKIMVVAMETLQHVITIHELPKLPYAEALC